MDAFLENMHTHGFTPSSTFGLEDQDGEETSPLCFLCLLPSSDTALSWHCSHPWWVSQVWQLYSPVCFPSTSMVCHCHEFAPPQPLHVARVGLCQSHLSLTLLHRFSITRQKEYFPAFSLTTYQSLGGHVDLTCLRNGGPYHYSQH